MMKPGVQTWAGLVGHTGLAAKENLEIPRVGDWSMLQMWPLKPITTYSSDAWRIYDLHWLYVAVYQVAVVSVSFMTYAKEIPDCSLVELGGIIGDLETACRVCAVGAYQNLWEIQTPRSVGAGGELADSLAAQFIRIKVRENE
jgi:hypothetical protein